MKLDKPQNDNYSATVVEIKKIVPFDNCDNVVGTIIFGYQAIVPKSTPIGSIGIVFPAETQLSDEYCYQNNLYKHADRNKDQGQKGYIEDNRRIKAIKFRGNRSDCLFMPLSSLVWTGVDVNDLQVGDVFDKLNGKDVCNKYVVYHKPQSGQIAKKRESRVDQKFLPEHFDTSNYFKWSDTIHDDTELIITQKIHGTSIRIGNTIVKRKLSLVEKLLKKLGVKIQETEHDYVYGSRKVIKDANNPLQKHFYEKDIWTEQGSKLVGLIPQNFIIYAELIGWTSEGAPIQADYTYGIPKGQAELYVYRIAFVNDEGMIQDLSWDQILEFCEARDIKTVAEIMRVKKADFKPEELLDIRFFEKFPDKDMVWLGDDEKLVDEGVCIRVDENVPRIFKAKSPIFLGHETELLDKGTEDLETSQSENI